MDERSLGAYFLDFLNEIDTVEVYVEAAHHGKMPAHYDFDRKQRMIERARAAAITEAYRRHWFECFFPGLGSVASGLEREEVHLRSARDTENEMRETVGDPSGVGYVSNARHRSELKIVLWSALAQHLEARRLTVIATGAALLAASASVVAVVLTVISLAG